MTCRSKELPPIYYMTARIAFKKNKRISERFVWVVSVFDQPHEIMQYDKKTMSRLMSDTYGRNSKAKNKQIIVREITKKITLTNSNLTIDEHKRQNKN